MFTGIVQSIGTIEQLEQKTGLSSFVIELANGCAEGLAIGASIAINGVCLTVTHIDQKDKTCAKVSFDVMQQSLNLTNLHGLSNGSKVNIERSASLGAEVGGHVVSGHIDATATISDITESENNSVITFSYPERLAKYLLDRGFVALNGCSLTIANTNHQTYELSVSFIPETLRATIFGNAKVGDQINLEVDRQTQAIVDTVERVLAQRGSV